MAQKTSAISCWNLKTLPGLKRCILKEPLNKILRNTDSVTGYYVKQSLAPSDLQSLNWKTNYHTSTKTSCRKSFWLNMASSMADIIFRVHSNVASGLSSSSAFTELISVDGYEERQVTEANTSLSLEAVPQTCHQPAQMLHLALLPLTSYHALSTTDVTWMWPRKVTDKSVCEEHWDELLRLCVTNILNTKMSFKENVQAKSYSMCYI